MPSIASAGVEFAEFVADVSDSATGAIRSDRLAWWLGVPEEAVVASWRRSALTWEDFASCVLAILDGFQDVTLSLSQTLVSYREVPLSCEAGATAADYVRDGQPGLALCLVKKLRRKAVARAVGQDSAATG